MSERKRKRGEESRSERPNKKVATAATADNVKVSVVQDIGEWPPIIGGRIRSKPRDYVNESKSSQRLPRGFLSPPRLPSSLTGNVKRMVEHNCQRILSLCCTRPVTQPLITRRKKTRAPRKTFSTTISEFMILPMET